MKTKIITSLTIALIAVGLAACATEEQEQAQLAAQAKVSRADAEKAALAKVPGGTVKDAELEKEKGKLIWSFDISTPGSPNISEVAVDAITGVAGDVEIETPKDQAKENDEDAKKEKH